MTSTHPAGFEDRSSAAKYWIEHILDNIYNFPLTKEELKKELVAGLMNKLGSEKKERINKWANDKWEKITKNIPKELTQEDIIRIMDNITNMEKFDIQDIAYMLSSKDL